MLRRFAAALVAALLLSAFAVTAAGPAGAQDDLSKVVVRRIAFDPPTAERGGSAVLRIEFAFPPGFHMYPQSDAGQRPEFAWNLPAGWTAGAVEDVSVPHEVADSFGQKSMAFDREAVLRQTFTIGPDAATGDVELTGTGRWQYCDDSQCYLDRDVPLAARIAVAAGAAPPGGAQAAKDPVAGGPAPAVPGVEAPAPPPADAAPAPASGITLTLLAKAIGAGFITLLTPCVFPLLPVTVSYFSKQKGPALPRSIVYALGIVFTITVIGLIFNTSLDVMARGWWFNLAVGVLFFVLALSLFGLFDLRLPSFLVDASSSRVGSGGLVGAFFMAVTLALTSFSCSVPFLALMFDDFNAGGHTSAVVGLLTYSSVVALPFALCSLFPSMLTALPRAGAWMNAIKVTMGFVELALAFKFLRTVALNFGSDALPRGFVLAIWCACALGAAVYLLGFLVLPHDTKSESIGVVRLLFAVAFLSSALYLLPGVFRQPLANWIEAFIQSKPEEIASAAPGEAHSEIPWVKNDWEGALARARAAKRPVLMDLTGVG